MTPGSQAKATMDDIDRRVRAVFASQFRRECTDLHRGTRLIDLEIDSLDTVELAMQLEDEFDLGVIQDEEFERCVTIGDVADLVASKLEARS